MMIRALGIFAVTYALMNTQRSTFFRLDRPTAALTGAVLMIAAGVLTPDEAYRAIDWNTIVLLLGMFLLFFGALFIVVAGLDRSGVLAVAGNWLAPALREGGIFGLVKFSVVSVLASNVVSNVPWVVIAATWLPHGPGHEREWLALALSSTFAGNLTLLGSVANVIVFEIARERCAIGLWRFVAIGAPITLITTAAGLAVVWALT